MQLTAENVKQTFKNCLQDPENTLGPAIPVEGMIIRTTMDGKKIQEHLHSIGQMLHQLPVEFTSGLGGSFLNACMDEHGTQWGEQLHVDMLLCMGLASGKVEYLFERNEWLGLPGGAPVFAVNQ